MCIILEVSNITLTILRLMNCNPSSIHDVTLSLKLENRQNIWHEKIVLDATRIRSLSVEYKGSSKKKLKMILRELTISKLNSYVL